MNKCNIVFIDEVIKLLCMKPVHYEPVDFDERKNTITGICFAIFPFLFAIVLIMIA